MVNEGRTGVALGGNGGSRLCRWVVECQMSRCDPNCCPEGSSNGYPLAVQTLAVISRIPPPVFECDRRHIDAVGFEFPNNNISNVLERCNPPDFRHYDEHHTICFAFGNLFSVTLQVSRVCWKKTDLPRSAAARDAQRPILARAHTHPVRDVLASFLLAKTGRQWGKRDRTLAGKNCAPPARQSHLGNTDTTAPL